jgi:murein DD-endopeptidase MepM/ murein hydrolase activator NlpD
MPRYNILLLLFVLLGQPVAAQLKYYATPVRIPVSFSGNFGELRPDHFHMGLDFRTERRTGLPIHASAEGYVARVVVSPTGYGRALYVNHPNQTTTVYGHLLQFRSDIEAWVKEEQYRRKSFAVDLEVPAGKFTVARDERIALSGNTGSSGGPHLHFEIRDTPTQDALNPLTIDPFGVKDLTPPRLLAVRFYPLDHQSHVEFRNTPTPYTPVAQGPAYRLNPARAINAWGKIGLAVKVNDFFDNNTSPCGIRTARLLLNGTEIHRFTLDRIPFSQNRYLNSHIDYGLFVQNRERYHKLWLDPGNGLSVYTTGEARGMMTIDSGKVYQGEVILADVAGNETRFTFTLAGVAWPLPETRADGTTPFSWNSENSYATPDFEITTPAKAFYDDFVFYHQSTPSAHFYSEVHQVHFQTTPIHLPLRIRIKATSLPHSLAPKAFIALIDDMGIPRYAGGTLAEGWMETTIREFGNYTIATDTLPPVITPLSIKNNALTETASIRFTIRDDFSGIRSYNGYINGEWALFEYDPKNNRLVYRIDTSRTGSGKRHTLDLSVTDRAGNSAVYTATFWK